MSASAPGGRCGGRLFVAIDVGDAVRAEVARVVAEIGAKLEAAKRPPKVTWVKPAALHITLKFLGETSAEEAARVCELLAPPFRTEPFEIEWRGIGAFPSPRHPRALWMGVIRGASQLGAIESEVARRLGNPGGHEARPFLPHLTLGRIKMVGQGVDWPKLLQAIDVRGVVSRAEQVTLYRSELSQRGPHYTGLVNAPLIMNNE
ncbi:MAG: 2'-5' RNA ligase [Acidobacteria bacterium RIFCSPLOWO2_12_FULL_67_14b]|nr:MAG: 2'-5' RNA ligase [Acidobacteria bacterium RIFCSPLOWO2_12_FULL_67_14b]